jgi:mRNA-degrading endonuclease RelE of RelBE toxin-antitoxin system
MRIALTDSAKSQLVKLAKSEQRLIAKKLLHIESSGLSSAMKIKNSLLYRIRIGNYRALGSFESNLFIVMYIGHRSSVYKELQ